MTCQFSDVTKVVQRDGRGGVAVNRARQSAQNTGMTCVFTQLGEKGTGGSAHLNYHLDRMAAYLVAMSGDTNKSEACNAVATTPAATPDLARVKLKP